MQDNSSQRAGPGAKTKTLGEEASAEVEGGMDGRGTGPQRPIRHVRVEIDDELLEIGAACEAKCVLTLGGVYRVKTKGEVRERVGERDSW